MIAFEYDVLPLALHSSIIHVSTLRNTRWQGRLDEPRSRDDNGALLATQTRPGPIFDYYRIHRERPKLGPPFYVSDAGAY